MKENRVNHNFLNIIDNQDKAYILGLWYADGTVYEKTNCIKIDLIDKEILEKIKDTIEYNGEIKKYVQGKKRFYGIEYECKDSYRLSLSSSQLKNRLIELGCVPNKSSILRFPRKEQVPDKFIKDFIRGYFDGNGTIGYWIPKTKNNTNWKKFNFGFCGSSEIIISISNILSSKFNCSPSITDRFPERDNNNLQIEICGNRLIKEISDWIYKDANLYLERKYQKYLELLKECDRVDNDNRLYGSAHPRRKAIRLKDLKIYESLSSASKDNNFSGASSINYKCKKRDGFMYLDDYEKEVK